MQTGSIWRPMLSISRIGVAINAKINRFKIRSKIKKNIFWLTVFVLYGRRGVEDLHRSDDEDRDVDDDGRQRLPFPPTPMSSQPQNVVEVTSKHCVGSSENDVGGLKATLQLSSSDIELSNIISAVNWTPPFSSRFLRWRWRCLSPSPSLSFSPRIWFCCSNKEAIISIRPPWLIFICRSKPRNCLAFDENVFFAVFCL